jgi:hypothetical protein
LEEEQIIRSGIDMFNPKNMDIVILYGGRKKELFL